jgi:hypothetical protein
MDPAICLQRHKMRGSMPAHDGFVEIGTDNRLRVAPCR